MNMNTDGKGLGGRLSEMTAELTRQRLAADSRASRMLEAFDTLRREFEMAEVAPLPKWNGRVDFDTGDVATMEDEAFAKLRVGVTRERDLAKRMAGQSALARLVVGAIAEKRKRLKALDERIANGSADEAEIGVARRRKTFINEGVEVLCRRLNAVLRDFARSRKALLSRVVALTTEIVAVVPRYDDVVKGIFSATPCDIRSSLGLLGEAEERLREGSRSKLAGISELKGRAR